MPTRPRFDYDARMQSEVKQAAESHWQSIALVLTAALALRAGAALVALAVAHPEPQFHEPDSDGYLRLAAEWWRTGRYAIAAEPEILWPPGYPLLLLPGVISGHADLVTIALQNILACVTVWLVYRTAVALFNQNATALGAAWLFACEPMSVLYTSKLLGETAFTTVIAATVYLLVQYMAAPGWRRVLAAAASVAAAAYLRPIACYLPIWLGISLIVIEWWKRPDRRRLVLHTLAFVSLGMAFLAAWQFRNWQQSGYAGFSAVSDKNLYYYEALPMLAEQRGGLPAQRQSARHEAGETDLAIYLRQHPEQAAWTAPERYRFLRAEAIRTIRADPLTWARIHLMGVLHTLTDSGRNAWLSFFRLADTRAPGQPQPPRTLWQRLIKAASHRPAILAIHALLIAIVATYLLLALIGVLRSLRIRSAMLVLSVAVYLLLLSGGDAGYHRFRLPVTPAICLFAAYGYSYATSRTRRRPAAHSSRDDAHEVG